MEAANVALQDTDPDVCREVAFALGEWGDAKAVEIIRRIVVPWDAGYNRNPGERTAAVRSLGRIGGPEALKILEQLQTGDPSSEVRSGVLHVHGALVKRPEPEPTAQTRGAGRTRGGNSETRQVLDLLEHVRTNDPSWHVRDVADEVLTDLGI